METGYTQLIKHLPEQLAERTRLANLQEVAADGEYVLYWLHHAMRADENPALDVAVSMANHLRIPLLVYQAIPETYPFASDRHHIFMLEGARDLEQQFQERGIKYALHLARRGYREPRLRELCERAAIVITEDMPVEPVRGWTEKLASTCQAPVFCVDTACVVPMRMVRKPHLRAFQFRKATETLYEQRLGRSWSNVELQPCLDTISLPFEPLSLVDRDLADLVADCEIDHSIAPVPHTHGGSSAGYARWRAFQERGLSHYARHRNNPLIDGTSRLSAYLHYGMISPQKIAREAADVRTQGSQKFLDELLIWRELAYAFCYYRRDYESLDALPSWARETLAERESDPRPVLHCWETLSRGNTGDKLWDAAQRSLLMHGELHNNVRMTWGKALLQWTPSAQSALDMMIDLNHRYALDGRDPASYGGILWCLGQFDRPFPPARPVLGTVRDRSTSEHVKRLDPDRYFKQSTRPLVQPQPHVAIVGAGISGLICGRMLQDHGMRVTIFEKSRGVGGRMATRRVADGPQFDHGAQYFTVRDHRFQRYVHSWVHQGIVSPWEGRLCTLANGKVHWKENTTPRFVGVPGMNAICRHLAEELQIEFNTRVRAPELREGLWTVVAEDDQQLGEFDCFITSAPAPKSAELLGAAPQLREAAERTPMNGCWAVMLTFDESLALPFDGAFVHDSPLSWIARNDTKPERHGESDCWVLHASPEWTTENLEAAPDDVLPQLLDAFWQAIGKRSSPSHAASHRWRFSIPVDPLPNRSLFDPRLRIGACGDWCSGPRVEGAFLSGMAIAGRVLAQLLGVS